MSFKISGFGGSTGDKKEIIPSYEAEQRTDVPRRSVVQVRFPGKGMALSYYNDQNETDHFAR